MTDQLIKNIVFSIVELLNPIIQAGTYTVMDEQLSVDDQIDFIRGFPAFVRGKYVDEILMEKFIG